MRYLYFISIWFLLACNSAATESADRADSTGHEETVQKTVRGSDCGELYIFQKGKKLWHTNYDGKGKALARSVSEVTDVQTTESGLASVVSVQSISDENPIHYQTQYTCDGENMYFDVKSLFSSVSEGKIEIDNATMSFPLQLAPGQKLADVGFTMTMNDRMIVKTKIVNREVKALEKITTPAGTWDCYKVTASAEMDMTMKGMDEAAMAHFKKAQDAMPKQHYSFWMAPDFGMVQVEIYSGDAIQVKTVLEKIE